MQQKSAIKTLIAAKFKSEAQAAAALGWSRQQLNKITTGKKEPCLAEVNALAQLLGRPVGELVAIFLAANVTD